jgi:hypothetical protein
MISKHSVCGILTKVFMLLLEQRDVAKPDQSGCTLHATRRLGEVGFKILSIFDMLEQTFLIHCLLSQTSAAEQLRLLIASFLMNPQLVDNGRYRRFGTREWQHQGTIVMGKTLDYIGF